jgi:hypothetical protein
MIQGEPFPSTDLDGFDMMDDIDADWYTWATQRTFAPIRRVGHVGWMMYGDYWIHPQCPPPLRQVIEDPTKINTSIRLVAHGVEDTFCVVWEDGSLRSQFQNHYLALQDVLENLTHSDIIVSLVASHKSKQLTRAQQHLALSTQRSGDYFLYIHRSRGAFFQIPTKFMDILRDTLTGHGFQANDIWYQATEPNRGSARDKSLLKPDERISLVIAGLRPWQVPQFTRSPAPLLMVRWRMPSQDSQHVL